MDDCVNQLLTGYDWGLFGDWDFESCSGRIDHDDQLGLFIAQIVKLVWET